MSPADRDALATTIGRHPQVRAIVGGHLHRLAASALAGRPVIAAPPTYLHAHPDFDAGNGEARRRPARLRPPRPRRRRALVSGRAGPACSAPYSYTKLKYQVFISDFWRLRRRVTRCRSLGRGRTGPPKSHRSCCGTFPAPSSRSRRTGRCLPSTTTTMIPGRTWIAAEEILVREEDPSTGTVVFLMAGEKTLRLTDAASVLAASDIDRIDGLLSQQDAADLLTVEVGSGAITRQELGRLAHLADRHDLAVEIHLRGDG